MDIMDLMEIVFSMYINYLIKNYLQKKNYRIYPKDLLYQIVKENLFPLDGQMNLKVLLLIILMNM
jgi:hypothetical protein